MEEIAILKRHILESKDIGTPINYFFDLMDQNKILNAKGHRHVNNMENHSELCMAIKVSVDTANKLLNKQNTIFSQLFHEIPQEKFYHGLCTFSDAASFVLLYCTDLQTGVSALTRAGGKTDLFRFALGKVEDLKNVH